MKGCSEWRRMKGLRIRGEEEEEMVTGTASEDLSTPHTA